MSPDATSLTLRVLLKTAASRAGLGAVAPVTTGLSASAQALAVGIRASASPVLVIVPNDAHVEQMTSDVRFFYAALSGLGEVETARAVVPFPSPEVDPYRAIAPHLDVASARGRALAGMARRTARVVVASAPALLPRVSPPDRMLAVARDLIVGELLSPTTLGDLLSEAGFTHEDPVDQHGEFCVRGGVVDFFSAGEEHPVRVEFVGDLIESIRRYDPGTQRSIATIDRVSVTPLRDTLDEPTHFDASTPASIVTAYLTRGGVTQTIVCDQESCVEASSAVYERITRSYDEACRQGDTPIPPAVLMTSWDVVRDGLPGVTRFETLALDEDAEVHRLPCRPAMAFHGRLAAWVDEVRKGRERGDTQLFIAATPGRAERIAELLADEGLPTASVERPERTEGTALLVATGRISQGFRLVDAGLQIYTETDLFDEEHRVRERRRSIAGSFLSDLRDLKVGDHVVHVDHGIGGFVGLVQIAVGDNPHEFMQLRYAGEDKLFVPVEHLDLIQKYTGSQHPSLDRLGGTTWEKAKTRVRRAMRDMAEDLLKLYAARRAVTGHTFSPDTHWQEEFEAAFEYELTPDQETAVREIKRDMEAATPMDRLLCGDVGYGKTEVALRAAFKAVMDGKQVALLTPTTVLAFQHHKTLVERFAAFPVRIEMLSRFRARAEQKQVVDDLSAGKADMVVGTHRLLSKDVRFHDLGLLIVDEEQRFGVAHKERIKQLRQKVDVLTLTATPIPRTLNMALMGMRDMSVIETPPKDRLSIQTNVVRFDGDVIARAIRTEVDRRGQVYFVHNRIESIYAIGDYLRRLLPDLRLAVAHGQTGEAELERVMIDFVEHRYDVLLSTTIIENGLDIPNVNTIIINRAERYGLAQLYQLRGRVGRSDRRAYAYLLIPQEANLAGDAKQRLAAIKEFSDLGSGFRVAALDLEIRGAGNLLGGEQSGHIEAIGFDMYVKLLEQTVRELQGQPVEDEHRAKVSLGIDLRIDDDYITETNQRLAAYRRVAAAGDESALAGVLEELADRYGPIPPSVRRLGEYARIRILADRLGADSVDRERHLLVIRFRDDASVDPNRLVAMVQTRPDLSLTPPAVIRADLELLMQGGARRPRRQLVDQSTSWWTARARSGEVAPGFTKGEMLKTHATPTDTLLGQVTTLLTELRDAR